MSKPAARLTVTPALAQRMLDGRVPSRSPSARMIDHLAAKLKDGGWHPEAAVITTLPDGRVLNGQNVLEAIMQYGKAAEVTIEVAPVEPVGLHGRA